MLEDLFSLICHQRPDRMLTLGGADLPVCSRCAGLYVGLACALIGHALRGGTGVYSVRIRIVSAVMLIPTVLHVFFPVSMLGAANETRLVAGALAGTLLTPLLPWPALWWGSAGQSRQLARFATVTQLAAATLLSLAVLDGVDAADALVRTVIVLGAAVHWTMAARVALICGGFIRGSSALFSGRRPVTGRCVPRASQPIRPV